MIFSRNKKHVCEAFMRCSRIFSLILLFAIARGGTVNTALAQETVRTISVKFENTSVLNALREINRLSGNQVVFRTEEVAKETKRVTFESQNTPVITVVEKCLEGTTLNCTLREGRIIVVPQRLKDIQIEGIVQDESKQPLPGVTVLLKGTTLGTATDTDGKYKLTLPSNTPNPALVFSFIGMKTQEIAYSGQNKVNVTMTQEASEIDEVVVTGIFQKAKESYTGAATTITADDLKKVGNRNILTSIRNIDPSFNIIDNPTMGSDPNTLPDITIRGNSSMTTSLNDLQSDSRATQSANMPLFIMDGFEISLERMMDLDDNQIETITLLKDASATAMYGTRGANGVVVITTKQPEEGKLRLTYKGGIDLEAPDLSSYNLMNAKEKLAYEKAAGVYEYKVSDGIIDGGTTGQALQDLYNTRLLAAERGVDTYWLKYPVRTGVGHNHSLRLEGGREEIRYAVGLQYKNVAGAMKGSDRNTFNGNVFLSYKLKNITFQNDLQISHNKSINSPYGAFSDYANTNAYYKPYDDDGSLLKILDDTRYYYGDNTTRGVTNLSYNPLWNAYLPSIDESKYTQITNNFAIEWHILPELFVRGRFSITSQNKRADNYKAASHTDFAEYTGDDYERRGSYTMSWDELFKYEADFTLNYSKIWKEVHQLYVGLGYNFAEEKSEYYTVEAEGIPDDNSDFFGLAAMYAQNGTPYGDEGLSRRVGGILNANYTYDRRYFIDLSGKIEGSSRFGSDSRLAPFWSAGIGWNIHQEEFLQDNPWLNLARLRLSYGTSGSQNFDPYQAMRTFKYFGVENYNGLNGAYLLGIGNSDLGWQVTRQLNVGMELELWQHRIKLNVDFYNKLTDDMLSDITLPTSSGFNSYKENIGKVLNRGVEVSLNAYLIRNTESNIFWSVGGTLAYNKNTIKEIDESLDYLNDELLDSDGANPSFLYKEGESMNTIYAVRSLGINPANGKEMFLKLDGTRTYEWDAQDKVACGVNEPKAFGNLNTFFYWKGLSANAIFGYRLGGQIYNSTLAGKVENNNPLNNADRRAYYDRWREPGDIAKYKSVSDLTTTNATTRFVMDENTLECQSVSLGYEWESEWLARHLNISYLDLTLYGEDLFRISTVKQERGISYPYSRKFSLALTVRF